MTKENPDRHPSRFELPARAAILAGALLSAGCATTSDRLNHAQDTASQHKALQKLKVKLAGQEARLQGVDPLYSTNADFISGMEIEELGRNDNMLGVRMKVKLFSILDQANRLPSAREKEAIEIAAEIVERIYFIHNRPRNGGIYRSHATTIASDKEKLRQLIEELRKENSLLCDALTKTLNQTKPGEEMDTVPEDPHATATRNMREGMLKATGQNRDK